MDAFFASVEVLDDPSLAGKPVIVGGAGARGVVASCTYEARAYGVHSAMPSVRARQLCPEAIFLSGRHSRYAEVSARAAHDPARRHPDGGADRPRRGVHGRGRRGAAARAAAISIAHGLRDRVRDELGLGCAVGIGRSKMIAKLASRAAKPRASRAGLEPGPGVVLVDAGRRARRSCTATTSRRSGASGPATAKRLHDLGVRTVGDLAALPLDTRGAPARQGERRPPGRAGPRRGPRPGQPEPAQQVDRARGDVQPGPGRPARARAPRAAHGRLGGDHAARRVERGPHDHGEGQVQGLLAADALAHARSVPSPPAAPSGRWPRRCWRASIPARASACSG